MGKERVNQKPVQPNKSTGKGIHREENIAAVAKRLLLRITEDRKNCHGDLCKRVDNLDEMGIQPTRKRQLPYSKTYKIQHHETCGIKCTEMFPQL